MIIGIDPGKNGGVAFIPDTDEIEAKAVKCPETPHEMAEIITRAHLLSRDYNEKTFAVLEKVHSMPKQGVVSTFTFGTNYGMWKGILAAHKIPWIDVTPHKWQKFYGVMPKEKKSRKHKLKSLAYQYYPDIKVNLTTADAILLAHWFKNNG